VLAYAHVFQDTIVVGAPPHASRFDIDPDRLDAIDKSVGPPLERGEDDVPVLEEEPQGDVDGVAKLDQNLNRLAPNQPPWIVNAGRYRSDMDALAFGVNVHF
jgi:hypothetical protein